MDVVAGLSLKNLEPRVWDSQSLYHLPQLKAVMVSYADFNQMRARRRKAMKLGLHKYLNVPSGVSIYLDNGAFYFASNGGQPSAREYREFANRAKPDWRPIRFDDIPAPSMSPRRQRACFERTMEMNYRYEH